MNPHNVFGPLFFSLAAVFSLTASLSNAVEIEFEETILTPGTTALGEVEGAGLGSPLGTSNPEAWDFWLLDANLGDTVRVTVNRTSSALDPVIGVWDGVEFNTDAFTDIFSDSENFALIGSGDDELPPATGSGPFGDPSIEIAFDTEEFFLLAVADFGAVGNPVSPALGYEVVVTLIPEPSALLLTTLGSLGLLRRRR